MLADNPTPVSIGRQPSEPSGSDLSRILGLTAADVLRLHMSVIDREDRLESGTGEWLSSFTSDAAVRSTAAKESVLRSVHTATDPINFAILGSLSSGVGTPIEDLERVTGLSRLPLAERIGDLVSAGLAVKIPEANQVAGTPAGTAIVELVNSAGETGGRDLASTDR